MHHFTRSRRAILLAASSIAILSSVSAARAAEAIVSTAGPDAPELEVVVVTAPQGDAAALAPATAPLNAFQPTSIINRTFIEDSVADTSDYTGVVVNTPSLSGVNANGPGLSERDVVIRGFGDGEYNVLYDGIPFADTNDPTHHTTAYFPASTIGAAEVDRGPGEAGDLGQENFGGALKLFSRTLSDVPYVQQKATFGSWDTLNFVTTLQSGPIAQLNGMKVTANFQELWSHGYLSYAKTREFNQFLKLELPVAAGMTLTVMAEHNLGNTHDPDNDGATLAQVAKYGKNFSMNNNPASPAFWGYNTIHKETDFEYARLHDDLGGGLAFENTVYSYAYKNQTLSATDVTQNQAQVLAGTYPSKAVGTKAAPSGNHDVAGYDKLNSYRVIGDIIRGSKDFGFGELRAGAWYETSFTDRHRFDLDRTNGLPNPIEKPPATGPVPPANIQFLEHSKWFQYQLFADFELRPMANLTVTPGVKYIDFTRKVNAPVGSKTRLVNDVSRETFTKTLPFLTVNYRLMDNWSVYGQYAKGFVIPPLSIFYVPNADQNAGLKPQQSTNYQLGSVFNTGRLTLGGDVYYIEFTDKVDKVGPSNNAYYANIPGKVKYQGAEAEANFLLTDGLSIFVNGSVNSAKDEDDKQIAEAPEWTAAGGVIYKSRGWTVSMINKFVGPQWADDGEPDYYKIDAYNTTNLVVGYDFGRVKAQLGIYNLFDHQDITDVSIVDGPLPNPLDTHDQYFFQPERSFQFTLRGTL